MVSLNVQQLLTEAQAYQQQMQVVVAQKEALNLQLIETGKALEELSKPGNDDVYKTVGPVLIKVEKGKVKHDLKSKKDLIMLRMKSLEKSESTLKNKLDDMKEMLAKTGE